MHASSVPEARPEGCKARSCMSRYGFGFAGGFWIGVFVGCIGGGVSIIAQPLGSDLCKSSAIALEDRIAAGVGLPTFDGDVDVSRADFQRDDGSPVGLARHDLRTRTTERLVAKPTPRHMLAHRDPERIQRLRRGMIGPVNLGETEQSPSGCEGFLGHLRRAGSGGASP